MAQDPGIKADGKARSMMWGKHYASTYEGSMVGSGAAVFAVWGYVIAKMQPDKEVGAQVELNPELVAFVIGETEAVIEKAIGRLCAPDKRSRSKEEEGRRLVKIGQFAYRVVNGPKYLGLKNLDEKRAGDRERKRKQRSKVTGNGAPLAGEATYEKILESEGQAAADAFVDKMSSSSASNEGGKMNTSPKTVEEWVKSEQAKYSAEADKAQDRIQEPASPLDLPEAEIPEL